MGIRGRQYTPMDEPAFNKAIPGTEALAGAKGHFWRIP